MRALAVGGVSFWQAVSVNCFGLAFYVVLGSLEAADAGALIGIGVSKSAAVSAILVSRALTVGVTVAISALVLIALHDQWPAILHPRHERSA